MLHHLWRFFRHDEGTSQSYWNVASGALEQTQRLYRVLYVSSTLRIDEECTIDVAQKDHPHLQQFAHFLLKLPCDLDALFLQAVSDLLAEDPWLQLINIHPPPDTESGAAVSVSSVHVVS